MPETAALSVDGLPAAAERGITVAAALENSRLAACRASVTGQRRAALCAMGVCFECRVTIDGIPHRRACMEMVRDGMAIETGKSQVPGPRSQVETAETLECEVAVIGAGPAGIAAACRAAERGAATVLLDEGLAPGGQIHRHLPSVPAPAAARRWLERLARSGAAVRTESAVFDAEREGSGFRIAAHTPKGPLRLRTRRLVLATGARELFLPFPGWTLPGVMGAGGAQALWKSGASFAGRKAVVAGSGPLLLPVAASLSKAGASLEFVAEQASFASLAHFGAALALHPHRLLDAAGYRRAFSGSPYRTGTWIVEAGGRERLEFVVLTDGRGRFQVECDLAAVGFGLAPNVELARLLGCEIRGGAVVAGDTQSTSVDGVFAAGEPCGVAGVEVAIAEGARAGISAAGRGAIPAREARRLASARSRGRRLAAVMNRAFRPRQELAALAREDTIVCRCEDVPHGSIAACASLREAKLSTRAGMGPCQGRVCGPALAFLFGWESDTVRPPVKPASLGELVAMEESA